VRGAASKVRGTECNPTTATCALQAEGTNG